MAVRLAKPDALIQIGKGHGLRTEKWAYMWFPATKKTKRQKQTPEAFMLFDMENDPNQYTNLAGLPQHANIERTLRSRLKARVAAAE